MPRCLYVVVTRRVFRKRRQVRSKDGLFDRSTVRLFGGSGQRSAFSGQGRGRWTVGLLDYSTVWLFGCWPSLSRTWRVSRFEHLGAPPLRSSASTVVETARLWLLKADRRELTASFENAETGPKTQPAVAFGAPRRGGIMGLTPIRTTRTEPRPNNHHKRYKEVYATLEKELRPV